MLSTESCKKKDEVSAERASALYVHVPFCKAKCRYCDFYSVRFDQDAGRRFVRAARIELDSHAGSLNTPLASVFLGGGTPTVLGSDILSELLSAVAGLLDEDIEFSIEANPATVSPRLAETLVACGVSRVNLGVQSFKAGELATLGRIHSPRQARRAVEVIRAAGISNVGLDLIYGIPHQTLASWRASLEEALSLQPEHLSCYALSFESGTPLGDDLSAGRVEAMDEQLQRDCYYAAIDSAERAGLEHYEISNFARPGRRCRHNLTYWRNESYLGIGPSAVSYIDGVRRKNAADLSAYIEALLAGQPPEGTEERLIGREAMAETLMLALRLIDGADRRRFAQRFGQDPLEAFPATIGRYAELGAMVVTDSHIRFSRDALFVSDTPLADLLAEA